MVANGEQIGTDNQLSVDYFVSKVERNLELYFSDHTTYQGSSLHKGQILDEFIDDCIDNLGDYYILQIAFSNIFLANEVYSSSFNSNTMTAIDLIKANLKEDIRGQLTESRTYCRI